MLYSFSIITFIAIVLTPHEGLAQQKRSDSLETVLNAIRREWGTIVDTTIVNLLNNVANEYRTSNPFKALDYCEEAQKYARKLGYKRGIAEAVSNMGNINIQQGNYDRAIEHYLEALKIYEELVEPRHIAFTVNELGNTYSRRGNIRQALENYEKARRIYTEINDTHGLAHTLGNLANLNYNNGNDSIALTFYQKALSLQREFGDSTKSVAPALNGIGLAYLNLGDYDKALEFLYAAERIFSVSNDVELMVLGDVYNNIALAYLSKRQYKLALQKVHRALEIAQESGLRPLRQNSYAILSDIYRDMGNYQLALDYSQRDNLLKDTIFNEESDKRLAAAVRSYEITRKEDSIRTLTKDKQIQDQQLQLQTQQLQLQNQQLIFLAIGFAMIFVIVGLLANGYRVKRRSEQQLQHKNTELESANQEIALKNQHLEELNNEKNEFLGIVAHDLKSPILSIKLLAQLLHDTNVAQEERIRFTNTIISSSDQLSRIISNLLNVNAIERGGITLDITPFNLSVAAYSVFEEYTPRAEAKNVTLHFESFTDGECLGDHTAVLQVMDNLVSNALKYSPGNKNVWFRIYGEKAWTHRNDTAYALQTGVQNATNGFAGDLHKYPTKSCVRIEVQDEGPGLSDDDMKKLFGKFQRLSAKPTSGEQSTGLGLSIVKKMVEAMNGEVWCESAFGQGAVFVVELPQAEEE
jgi:signal transduction histidine kinase